MAREGLFLSLKGELSGAGYSYFFCSGSHSCFDVAARRDGGLQSSPGRASGKLFLVKVLENIDGLTKEHAESLSSVASLLRGQDFVLGERSRLAELDDGVIYERHGTPASNLATFSGILDDNMPNARKQNRLVFSINGESLKQRREEAEMTLKELSSVSGISRTTLFRYERNSTSATSEHAEKLVSLFGKGIISPASPKHKDAITTVFFGLTAARANGPFDILATDSRDRLIVGEEQDRRTLEKRSALFHPLSEMLSSYSCFLLSKAKEKEIGGVPVLTREELAEAEKPRDIISIVKERRN